LDVTPFTPSVSISFFEVALGDKARARKSSQTAWPCFSSAFDRIHDALCSILGFRHHFWREARVVNTWLAVPTSGIWVFETK